MSSSDPIPNKTLVFKRVPEGSIRPDVDMVIEDRPVVLTPPPRGMVVKTLVVGFDPHQRDRMRGPTFQSYVPGYVFDEPMNTFAVAKVLKSDHERFQDGDIVAGLLPIAEYGVIPEQLVTAKGHAYHLIQKVENKYDLDLGNWVGPLGLAGMTAWNSFYGIVKPEAGKTIWVNAASSAVGELVVQLAKKEGMRVIGSASSDDKCRYVVETLGADACFNYRTEASCDAALKRLAPEGLDVVYENVGGEHFEAAIGNLKDFGRIVVCGMIALYNQSPEEQYKVKNLSDIFRKRIHIQGFIFWDENIYEPNIDKFWELMPKWIADGSIKTRTSPFQGFDKAQEAFLSVFGGNTLGKATLRVADP